MAQNTPKKPPAAKPDAKSQPSSSSLPEGAGSTFLMFAEKDAADGRTLRRAVVIAIVFHLVGLLIFRLPELAADTKQEEKKKKIYVVQQVRFQPPPPKEKKELPKPKAKKVPIPDPTPDEPEPIRIEEPEPEIEMPEMDDLVFGIPDAPPPAEPEGPIHVGGDVNPPEKLHYPPPQYTEIARKARVQGVVIVQAIIDKTGSVNNVKVLKGLPMGLDEEAVKAIKQWKFKPATLNGKPVDVYYNLTVNFRLQ
ncbi:MAG: energy transducer TonB [Pseudomonadota bacterium]